MSGITLSTVFISALTSASVTLAIELFAKPTIEARKERILTRARVLSEVDRGINAILSGAGKLLAMDKIPTDLSERHRREWRTEITAAVDSINSNAADLEKRAGLLVGAMPFRSVIVLTRYVGCVRIVMSDEISRRECAEVLRELSEAVRSIWSVSGSSRLSLPWMRNGRIARAENVIDRWLGDTVSVTRLKKGQAAMSVTTLPVSPMDFE